MTTTQQPLPGYVAPEGYTAKTYLGEVKDTTVEVTENTEREIPAVLSDAYNYASRAVAYWEDQKRLITAEILKVAGDAEYATVNGIRVLQHRSYDTKEYVVPAGHTNGLWPASASSRNKR